MKKFKVVIFDIDGTLTPMNSWLAITRDIGGSVAEHLAIYEEHVKGGVGLDDAKRRLLEMWQASGNDNRSHIESLFDSWPVRPEAYSLISELKQYDYLVCLITGSISIYAEYMAKKLGVSKYYANGKLHFSKEGKLIDFDYTTDEASLKLHQFKDFCDSNGLLADECVVVGDSDNDIELFRATGHGILLLNKKVSDELRKVAWKQVTSLNEIMSLLLT